jgi:hypothetical protein
MLTTLCVGDQPSLDLHSKKQTLHLAGTEFEHAISVFRRWKTVNAFDFMATMIDLT